VDRIGFPLQNHQEEIHIKINTDEHFSTPIWHVEEDLPSGAYEWALEVQRNIPSVIRSNEGGYQSEPTSDWSKLIYVHHISKVLEFLPEFIFINWWVNINKKGDYNELHTHPGAELSAVWYITDNFDSIHFQDPSEHSRASLYQRINKNTNINYKCTAGDLLIFPSDLMHGVKPHTEDTPRISVSFNMAIPTDFGYFS
tara:strand:- start:149 stop:742 length:594 start_codon:yes stop_codon:yes gene_type:complete